MAPAFFIFAMAPMVMIFSLESESSLLPPTRETQIQYQGAKLEVPCIIFDDWCAQNQIDHIDVLRLELEGLELEVLQSSPKILKSVKIIIVQSFFHPYRERMANYFSPEGFSCKV